MRKGWHVLAAGVLMAMLLVGVTAVAQDSGPSLVVHVGMDGYCIEGRWCPVRVVMANSGPGFEGEVQIEIRDYYGSDVYSHPVVLPTGSRKAYFLHIPATRSFQVRLLSGDRTLISQPVVPHILDPQDRLYGIVGENPSAFNFLSDVAPPGGQTVVAHLQPDELSSDYLGWQTLNMLVLNDSDTSAFSAEQLQTLETWVALGGHLLVGGGPGGPQTAAAVAHLLPVEVGAVRTVDNLAALGTYLHTAVTAGPYAVTEAALRDGADALIQQGNLVLLARRPLENGTVTFVAFDAALNPFPTRQEDRLRLWEMLTEVQPNRRPGFSVTDSYSAREAVATIPGIEPVSICQLLIFLLAYTVLIGPLNYFILRRFDRRELAWLTIPLLVLGFTACAYLTGFQIRGNSPILHQVGIVYAPAGSQRGRAVELVGIFSPRRARYDLRANNAAFSHIPETYSYDSSGPGAFSVVEEGSVRTLRNLRVELGGLQSLQAEGLVTVSPPTSDLQILIDASGEAWLRGTLQNGDLPLEDAMILAGQASYHIGNLEAHQQVAINTKMGSNPSLSSDLSSQILAAPSGGYYSDARLYRRYQLTRAYLSAYNQPFPAGVYLVGWRDEAALDIELIDQRASYQGTTLYIFGLSFTASRSGQHITFGPEQISREVEGTSGYPEFYPDVIGLPPGSEVTFRFTIWPQTTITQVTSLQISLTSPDTFNDPPQVLLWNWETASWDEQTVSWNDNQIPNPGPYVRSDGTVRMQLSSLRSYIYLNSVLITIEGQQ